MGLRRSITVLFTLLVLGTACATSGKFDDKLRTWKGKDADSVVRWWGQPDSTEKLSNGDRMYVYARLHHTPLSFPDAEGNSQQAEAHRSAASSDVYLHCSCYFEVNSLGKIASVYSRGEDCVSKD